MPFTDSMKVVDVVITDRSELNATSSDVLSGKKFIGNLKTASTGSIPVLPSKSDITLVAGETYSVPFGFNPNSYNVNVQSLPDQTTGTATSSDILDGKIAWVDGQEIIGSMANIGTENITVECGETKPLSAGYHDGNGIVTGASLSSQTIGDATASDIAEGKTAWVNGEEIVGEIPSYPQMRIDVSAGETVPIPAGFYRTAGEAIGQDLEYQTSATATAEEIVDGKTAWVNGEKLTGTMVSNLNSIIDLPINGTYQIPQGYHTGLGTVTQNIPSSPGETVTPSKDNQVVHLSGYYMEGDVIVNGIDALNYNLDSEIMHTDTSDEISNYELNVINNNCTIKLYGDNWHDNATINVYRLEFSDLIDENNESVNIDCNILISNGFSSNIVFGNISIRAAFSIEDECQYIQISGITSGKLTMTNTFKARIFGTEDIPPQPVQIYTIRFDLLGTNFSIDNHLYRTEVTQSNNPDIIELEAGDLILEHLNDPSFVVYDENDNIVEMPNIIFKGWCTDPERIDSLITAETIISSHLLLYPFFTVAVE